MSTYTAKLIAQKKPKAPAYSAMSYLTQIETAPPNPIFNLTARYKEDKDPNALNLGVGAYRDAAGNPWVLPVVKTAERLLLLQLEAGEINHEYLPIGGLNEFVKNSYELACGADNVVLKQNRVGGVQCISGTGSLRTIGEFCAKFNANKDILVSNPTWGNHNAIFKAAGLNVSSYNYWNPETRGLDLEGMKKDLNGASDGATVVLHACAHNPTGVDPTVDQWKEIGEICKAKGFTVVFDSAYIGFASGCPDTDSASYRLFMTMDIPVFICQSYSKNFGLYNERTGAVICVGPTAEATVAIVSQLKILVRANWSNPPAHGARIVAIVLGTPELRAEWFAHLQEMSGRIKQMRAALKAALVAKDTPGTWEHITRQIGMFSFTGLTPDQVDFINEKYHIYMLKNGRVNMCGLTEPTVEHLATAIHDAVTAKSSL